MNKINFFTPISYQDYNLSNDHLLPQKTWSDRLLQLTDNYLFFGGEKAYIMTREFTEIKKDNVYNNIPYKKSCRDKFIIRHDAISCTRKILLIASYFFTSGILPLLALITRTVLYYRRDFELLENVEEMKTSENGSKSDLQTNQESRSNILILQEEISFPNNKINENSIKKIDRKFLLEMNEKIEKVNKKLFVFSKSDLQTKQESPSNTVILSEEITIHNNKVNENIVKKIDKIFLLKMDKKIEKINKKFFIFSDLKNNNFIKNQSLEEISELFYKFSTGYNFFAENDKNKMYNLNLYFSEDFKQIYLNQTNNIGQGSFGQVYKVFDLMRKEFVAFKTISDGNSGVSIEDSEKTLLNESQVLEKVNPNSQNIGLLPFFSTIRKVIKIELHISSFSRGKASELLVIPMKLMDTDCCPRALSKVGFYSLPIKERLTILQQPLKGLMHMHRQLWFHKDIKPQNLLFNVKDKQMVLCDFGSTGTASAKDASIDLKEIGNIRSRNNLPHHTEDITEEGADVYALAKSFIDILAGDYWNNIIKDPEITHAYLKNYPLKLVDLLIRGVGPKKERPNAEEFNDEYERILQAM